MKGLKTSHPNNRSDNGCDNYAAWRTPETGDPRCKKWTRDDALLALQAEFWWRNPKNDRKNFDKRNCQIQQDHPALKKYKELESLINWFYDENNKRNGNGVDIIRSIGQKVRNAWVSFHSDNSADWRKELPTPCEMILDRFIHPRGANFGLVSALTQAMGIIAELDSMHIPESYEQFPKGYPSSMTNGTEETTERLDATRIEQILQEQANLRDRVAVLETAVLNRLVTNQINHSPASDKANGNSSKATETRPATVVQTDSSIASSSEPTKTKSSSVSQNKSSSGIATPTSKAMKNKSSPLCQADGSNSVARGSSKAPGDKLGTASKSDLGPLKDNAIGKMLGSSTRKRGRTQDGEGGGRIQEGKGVWQALARVNECSAMGGFDSGATQR